MILFLSLLAAAQPAAAATPPSAAGDFLSGVASGDLGAARARLSEHVVIMDERSGRPVASSLEAFAESVRGCARSDDFSDSDPEDPSRTVVTATWTCPSRLPSSVAIWTEGSRVVHIQFGMPAGS